MEGLGVTLAGVFGTGSGTTSFSENVAIIGITRVASRRVRNSHVTLKHKCMQFNKK